MDSFLTGKQVLVTGGSRGIGYAVAASLLRAGAGVAICARTAESVERAVAALRAETDGRVCGTPCDVGNDKEVHELFQFVDRELGGLDILVNNAGVGIFRPVGEMSVAEWRQTIDTNLTGAFLCTREALGRFRIRGGGFVINISSLAGKNPFPGGAAYNASKFGMNGFSEALMMDHRYDNVRVSYIMPGSVATDFRPGTAGAEADWKIAPEDVAEIILMILRMPARTLVSRVEVRPSQPKK